MSSQKISIVIPSFNEEDNIAVVAEKVIEQLKGFEYELIFVDDGSKDKTLGHLKILNASNPNIHFLSFSRNFGHMAALKAGLDAATGDCVISMDADLQHPPRLLPEMIAHWQEGYEVVYTVREESKDNSWFKNKTANMFYSLLNKLSDIELEQGAADFRLLDRKVVEVIKKSGEINLFLRGYIAWVGFKKFKIAYQPDKRFSGVTKYTFKKMFRFALNGITSFSIKPLHFSTIIGVIISGFAFLYALYALWVYFFTEQAITGWASVLISVLFIGGIQLLMLGIIGEYLGTIVVQTKGRPDYIVSESSLSRVASIE